MAHILITSGPTRQYLDPIRYLSNGSTGQMGCSLAAAAIALGHSVTIVSGPVNIKYPSEATVINVVTTEEMLDAAVEQFPSCDGVIAVAAPCDFKPAEVAQAKIKKESAELVLKLVDTPDILATLGEQKKSNQWSIGFALETNNGVEHAVGKLKRKNCDLIVLNGAAAIGSSESSIQVIDRSGEIVLSVAGPKSEVAAAIVKQIENL